MTEERILNVLGNVCECYIEEAAPVERIRKRSGWLRLAAAVACICIAAALAVLFLTDSSSGRFVISDYKSGSEGCYITPEPGEVIFEIPVREAREKYTGKNAVFILSFSINNGEKEELTGDALNDEYERMISEGYELRMVKRYAYGGDEYDNVVVGYFTEEQLADFICDPRYGYLFYFVRNGDGSPLRVDDSDAVTDFPANHT